MDEPPLAPAAAAGRPIVRLRRRLAWTAATLGCALLLAWGLDVSGVGLPDVLARIVCVAALLALLVWAGVAL
ncbi:MAG TPA: hypothetical protein VGE98_07455, partial [Thermoanaerobaculia bacterium]